VRGRAVCGRAAAAAASLLRRADSSRAETGRCSASERKSGAERRRDGTGAADAPAVLVGSAS
jgi:hypothetical protein